MIFLILTAITFPAWGGFSWGLLSDRFSRQVEMVANIPVDGDNELEATARARAEVLTKHPHGTITNTAWFYDQHMRPYVQVSFIVPNRR